MDCKCLERLKEDTGIDFEKGPHYADCKVLEEELTNQQNGNLK